jgi:hypothetical protein
MFVAVGLLLAVVSVIILVRRKRRREEDLFMDAFIESSMSHVMRHPGSATEDVINAGLARAGEKLLQKHGGDKSKMVRTANRSLSRLKGLE